VADAFEGANLMSTDPAPVCEDHERPHLAGAVTFRHRDEEYETVSRTPAQVIQGGVDAERFGFRRVWISERIDIKWSDVILSGIAARTSRPDVCTGGHRPEDASPMDCRGLRRDHAGLLIGYFSATSITVARIPSGAGTGILGTNKRDADRTAATLLADLEAGVLRQPDFMDAAAIDALLAYHVSFDGDRSLAGATSIDGEMVDEAHRAGALRLLARSGGGE